MRSESRRGIEIAVAMDAAEAEKLRLREPRDRAEDALLTAGLQSSLEADEVPHLRRAVFLPQLDDGVWLAPRLRVGQPDRLHRPEPQRLNATLRHLLDRQASFEVRHRVEL